MLVNANSNTNSVEALGARISALESLLGLFGAATPTAAGTNGLVKGAAVGQQSYLLRGDRTWENPAIFAKPADIDTAISNLIGGAPNALNTLDELAQALADDASFASTTTNLLAGKVTLTGDEVIAGNKRFSGFTALGEFVPGVKFKLITGTTAANQGTARAIAHGLIGDKIMGVQVLVRHIANSAVSLRLSSSAGYDYDWAYDANNIYIYNSNSNSAAILSKPVVILITYTN